MGEEVYAHREESLRVGDTAWEEFERTEKKAKEEQKYSHMKDCPLIADYSSVSHS